MQLDGNGYLVIKKQITTATTTTKMETETAQVVVVRDWNNWCWDVCISYDPSFDEEWHSSCQAIQFPRYIKPEIGDIVEFIDKQVVLHKGKEIAIDLRHVRMDEEGYLYLD